MATPFTVFRRHSGLMMALLCGFLMVAFLLADPFLQYFGAAPGGGADPRAGELVATWDRGSLNERQLAQLVLHRRILAEFHRQVYAIGQREANEAGAGELPLRVAPLSLPETPQQGVERDVVLTRILADRAEDQEMFVSDEMIVEYLRALGRDRVSVSQMRTLIGGMRIDSGTKATIQFVFQLLREAMLAHNYRVSHRFAFFTTLPSQRWNDWREVNDRIVLEAAPLPVERFLDKVEDPSDAELKEFYEAYRDRVPAPDVFPQYGAVEIASPNPGFATPERVRLVSLVARFDDFARLAEKDVTEEEIAAFYDRNRESFLRADRGLFGEDDSLGPDQGDSLGLDQDAAETTSDATQDEPKSDADEDAAKSTGTKMSAGASAGAEPGDAAPSDDPAAGRTEATTEPADVAPPADEATTSDNPLRSEAESPESSEEEEEEEEQAEPDASAEQGPEAQTKKSDEDYQPLDEVRDEIRRRLAQDKAAEKLGDLVARAKRRLNESYAEYFDALLDAEDADREPPSPPAALTDPAPVAEEFGLTVQETPLESRLGLRASDLGQSVDANDTGAQQPPLWLLAFAKEVLDLYEPIETYDLDGNRYLSLVVERQPREVPELDKIRDEVVAAWKRRKAADLALAEAERLATEAEKSGKTLAAQFADDPDVNPVETDPFGFLTIGSISPTTGAVSLRLSQPEPLVAPGPEMLRMAIDLGPNEVKAALNHERSFAYVMRVATRLDAPAKLRGDFLQEGDRWFGLPSLTQKRALLTESAVFESLVDAAGLDWRREPDQFR